MPEQPQWFERTLDMPPQDPWAEPPTAPSPAPFAGGAAHPGEQPQSPFSQGRARVTPRGQQHTQAEHEPTGTGWPGAAPPAQHRGMGWRWSELRRGVEWSNAGVLFAFVCWGIWAISEGTSPASLVTPAIVFMVTIAVSVGVFCLSRVVGYLVLVRWLGRMRRSARGAHLITAVFLAGVGVADLRQTEWVMTAYHWVAGQI
jgi:hypothetical protein